MYVLRAIWEMNNMRVAGIIGPDNAIIAGIGGIDTSFIVNIILVEGQVPNHCCCNPGVLHFILPIIDMISPG
jgi:hypothetical protein